MLKDRLLTMGAAGAVLAATSIASASVINFDDGINPFSGGTISTDQAFSGTNSLYLGAGNTAVYQLPESFVGKDITITMMVFDLGKWINREVTGTGGPGPTTQVHGPRWGVTGITDFGAAIQARSGDTASRYSHGTEGRFAASWFGTGDFGGPRQVVELGDGGSLDGGNYVLPSEGIGAWSQWTFDITADGIVTLSNADIIEGGEVVTITRNVGGPVTEIFLFGGRNHDTAGLPLAGIYFDDVRVVPEPGMLSLAALGLAGLAMRRRRA